MKIISSSSSLSLNYLNNTRLFLFYNYGFKGVRSDKERLPKSYSRRVASVEVVRRRVPEGSRVREVMVEGAGFCGKGVSSVRVGVGVEVGGAFAQFRLYFVLVRGDEGCFFAVHCRLVSLIFFNEI